eukprot:c17224_g1_i3.p1 GENE.c17224_g1_i3~~c17224_g1_i3.p1  ORF type:complete len:240 (+),score=21.48 c17224_g1_i3:433-1152(+)
MGKNLHRTCRCYVWVIGRDIFPVRSMAGPLHPDRNVWIASKTSLYDGEYEVMVSCESYCKSAEALIQPEYQKLRDNILNAKRAKKSRGKRASAQNSTSTGAPSNGQQSQSDSLSSNVNIDDLMEENWDESTPLITQDVPQVASEPVFEIESATGGQPHREESTEQPSQELNPQTPIQTTSDPRMGAITSRNGTFYDPKPRPPPNRIRVRRSPESPVQQSREKRRCSPRTSKNHCVSNQK